MEKIKKIKVSYKNICFFYRTYSTSIKKNMLSGNLKVKSMISFIILHTTKPSPFFKFSRNIL